MRTVARDLRQALRILRRNPGFAAVAILSLGLGIGANTAVFSVVNSVFLKPLPVQNPQRLYFVYTADQKNRGRLTVSYPNYKDYRDRNQVMSGLLLYSTVPLSLTGAGEPELIIGQIASGNYFSVLGVPPMLGRAFLPEEDQVPGAHPVLVISHSLWMRRFGGRPEILGKPVLLNGQPFVVIGIAPPEFHGTNLLAKTDIWVPMMMYQQVFPRADLFLNRRALLFSCIARLRPGVSPEQALAGMQTVARGLEDEHREENAGRSVTLAPLSQGTIMASFREAFVRTGTLLMSVVALVLVVACANLATLLLARSGARTREIAIRRSMGAGRGRVIRQLLTESVLLAFLGGALGLLLARWARDLLWAARPPLLTFTLASFELDARVLWFSLATTLATGVLFGLAPALQTTRAELVTELKERAGQPAGSRRAFGGRNVLVAAQVALSLVALVAAGLFLRSLYNARQLDPGFESHRLLMLSFDLGPAGYTPPRAREFCRRVLERVRALPATEAAALAGTAPFGGGLAKTVIPEGQAAPAGRKGSIVLWNNVDADYLPTLGIPLRKGRNFTPLDRQDAPRVAIINQAMADRYWPAQEAIGRRFSFLGPNAPVQVVGVARNANYVALGEDPRPMIYTPLAQDYSSSVALHVRTTGDPAAVIGMVRREVQALDPHLLLHDVRTMPQTIAEGLWAPRLGAALLTIFGTLALLLSTLGIYGVLSYSVMQRAREIGIRMALGAQRADVLKQVLAEGMKPVSIGLVCGLAGALALARLVSSLLFGVPGNDPLTFAAVSLVLVAAALLGCYLPARRAAKVDPALALRHE